jgi:hypothetical protein
MNQNEIDETFREELTFLRSEIAWAISRFVTKTGLILKHAPYSIAEDFSNDFIDNNLENQ